MATRNEEMRRIREVAAKALDGCGDAIRHVAPTCDLAGDDDPIWAMYRSGFEDALLLAEAMLSGARISMGDEGEILSTVIATYYQLARRDLSRMVDRLRSEGKLDEGGEKADDSLRDRLREALA